MRPQTFATAAVRNAFPVLARDVGMVCYQADNLTLYQAVRSGTGAACWERIATVGAASPPLLFGASTVLTTDTTAYLRPGNAEVGATATLIGMQMRGSGILKYAGVRARDALTTPGSCTEMVFTLLKASTLEGLSAGATALELTLPTAAFTTPVYDDETEIEYADKEWIGVSMNPDAAPTTSGTPNVMFTVGVLPSLT